MTEQLGTGYELWNLTRPQPAVHARLAAIHARLGRSPSAEDIAYMLVDFLLPEAINAAEGVERSYRTAQRGPGASGSRGQHG